uniref:hypothetical protein n=1 Tax=Serratia marcescens TaxID=615 RepID=UPI001CA33E0D
TNFNIMITTAIYKSDKKRETVEIEFSDIDNLVMTMDTIELIDNKKSGNISNGYIKNIKNEERYKFFLYLSDGLLSMSFKNLKLIT